MKLVALGLAFLSAATLSWAAPVDQDFKTVGVVGSGSAKDGTVWFATWDDDVHFVVSKTGDAEAQRLFDILKRSNTSSRSLVVTYDPFAARLANDGSTIDLPICSVQLDEQTFVPTPPCARRPDGADALADSTIRSIALGWAEAREGDNDAAINELSAALASKTLEKPLEAIAVRARALAEEQAGYSDSAAGRDGDGSWLAALTDHQRLAELRPNDAEVRISEGLDYERLGDYDAAERIYRTAIDKWPDEKFPLKVRLASLARTRGEYQRSLDLLNSLPEEFPDDIAMKFYYHRGWTLTKLGRFDEAIYDFTEGLKTQPDYPSAYLRRGCAYAALGRLGFAVGDLENAVGFMEDLPYAPNSRNMVLNLQLAKQLISRLKTAVAAGKNVAMPDVCDSLWRTVDDQPRKRSRLLNSK